MSPSALRARLQLAIRLELRENRLPQAFLPGNLLAIQHGTYRTRNFLATWRTSASSSLIPRPTPDGRWYSAFSTLSG